MTYPTEKQAEAFINAREIDLFSLFDNKTGELTTEGEALVISAMNLLQLASWTNAEVHGFHNEDSTPRDMGLVSALLHSEISEAFESYRAGEPDLWFKDTDENGAVTCNKDPYDDGGNIRKAEGVFAEWADEIIRLADSSEERMRKEGSVTLGEALVFKFRYNLTRSFKHGKVA